MTKPRERSIIYTGWEVRAILARLKVRTTVPAKEVMAIFAKHERCWGPKWSDRDRKWLLSREAMYTPRLREPFLIDCPFGVPGDRLIGKDTFCDRYCAIAHDRRIIYRADQKPRHAHIGRPGNRQWSPSTHMPRWASRLPLVITSVAVGRVGDVTVAEARSEGTDTLCIDCNGTGKEQMPCSPDDTVCEFCKGQGEYPHEFRKHWDSRWPKYPFAENPWGWHIGHELSKPGEGVGGDNR